MIYSFRHLSESKKGLVVSAMRRMNDKAYGAELARQTEHGWRQGHDCFSIKKSELLEVRRILGLDWGCSTMRPVVHGRLGEILDMIAEFNPTLDNKGGEDV